MKSILLHIHDDRGAESRLQAACDIARATGAHIRCAQVTQMPDMVAADMYGGAALAPSIINELREIDERIKAHTEERLRAEGVSWDWRQIDGDILHGLLAASTLTDVIVVTLPEGPRRVLTDPLPIAAQLALSGPVPVMAVPQSAKSLMVAGRALVAWDGSQEASAALRGAVPLLKLAQDVHIVIVEEVGKNAFPATDAPEYLARHGIKAEVHSWPRDGRAVEDALMAAVEALKPDWMVMGAYGHSRLRQFVFGGVTRTMLRDGRVPVLLAH